MDAAEERVNVLFLSFVSSKWRKIITPIAALAVISALLFFPREQADNNEFVVSGQNPFPETIEEEPEPTDTAISEEASPVTIVVDVKGAVQHPGVYSMEDGDRLIDAINAAGGYLLSADSRMLNHAMKLTDEFVVYVPVEGEEAIDIATSPTAGTTTQQEDGKININTADEQQLMTISGIGPAKASAIIQHRTDHGAFKAPESLMEVSGIGQKTFEKLASQITVK